MLQVSKLNVVGNCSNKIRNRHLNVEDVWVIQCIKFMKKTNTVYVHVFYKRKWFRSEHNKNLNKTKTSMKVAVVCSETFFEENKTLRQID